MAYQLKKGKKLARSVREAAEEQLESAIRQIRFIGRDHPDALHEARKHLKKARAVFALLRTLPDRSFADANRIARGVARRLSACRDDEVLLQTFDRLTAGLPEDEKHELSTFRNALCDRAAGAHSLSAARRRTLARPLEKLLEDVHAWNCQPFPPALRKGYEKGIRRVRRALHAVEENPQAGQVHAWRKRVKAHLYHVRLREPLDPHGLNKRRKQLVRLSRWLGFYQDLTVFRNQLGDDPIHLRLDRLAAIEQDRLLHQALPLGRKLFNV